MATTHAELTCGTKLSGVELRAVLLERYSGRCVWCGCPLSANEACCSVEHLVPRGGINGPSSRTLVNLAPAHKRCNLKRGSVGVADWLVICERHGKRPNRPAVIAALRELVKLDLTDGAANHARKQLRAMERDGLKRWDASAIASATQVARLRWSIRTVGV